MLNLAVCDDDTGEIASVAAFLEEYRDEKDLKLCHDDYSSVLDLIAAFQRGHRYDVLLMDVVMPGINGIAAAEEIRSLDKSVKIIFLTSSPDFALQSYAVDAYAYQLKPVRKEVLFRLLDKVAMEVKKQQDDSLVLKCRDGIARIELEQLEYCEIIGKTITFHLASGKVLECVGNMDKISESLMRHGGFYRVHRSYSINLDYITNISYKAVTMASEKEIPLPRGKLGEIKKAFLDRAQQKGWASL